MTDVRAILKKHDLKATAPRTALLSLLADKHAPMSAQDLHAKLPKTAPIDLVTVYRALESFQKAGIVKRVDLRTDSVLYELNDEHHHHIVCTECGLVEDFEMCDIELSVEKIARKSSGFASVRDHSLELFGVCNTCVKA